MTPEMIADLESELRDENPFSFAQLVLSPGTFEDVEQSIKEELNYEDIPGVHQRRGGEVAQRLLAVLRDMVLMQLEVVREGVASRVCPTYCQLKISGKVDSEALKIAIAVADALVSAKAGFPAPVTRTAVYIARNGVLDRWCDCSAFVARKPSDTAAGPIATPPGLAS